MRDHLVLRVVTKVAIPFILLFGFYVLLHGKYSPGGGFQAGVIFAAAFIAYALIFGPKHALSVIPISVMKTGAALGTLIYGAIGVGSLFLDGNFLNYNVFFDDLLVGQFWMIMLVEAAIGLTVTCVITALFFLFATYPFTSRRAGEGGPS